MNFSDTIFAELASRGIRQVFAVPGGGNMFLINAACSNPAMEVTFCHNEQAAAIAAEAFYKVARVPAVCLVTTGPGSTNAITGIVGAWLDSSSMIVLAGQVKIADKKPVGLRQKGPQEIDFIAMIDGSCLDSVEFGGPSRRDLIRVLDSLGSSPRKGPVVLSVPLDIQNSKREPIENPNQPSRFASGPTRFDFSSLLIELNNSSRPAILFGEGCRDISSTLLETFFDLCADHKIACLFSWLSYDLLAWDEPANMGRPGNVAKRFPNFVVQTSDVLVIIGSRLDNTQTAFDAHRFGLRSNPYLIDIDPNELDKMPTRYNKILANSSTFAEQFVEYFKRVDLPIHRNPWWDYCRHLKTRFGTEIPSQTRNSPSSGLSIDEVVDFLSNWIPAGTTIVTGSSGLSIEIFHVGFRNKTGQRIFLTTALGSMGFGLPAVVGVAQIDRVEEVVLFESDGSFMMNIQELATFKKIKKRVLVFLINNGGYASIRSSQKRHFGKIMGTDSTSGLVFPNFNKVINAFGFDCYTCVTLEELDNALRLTADTHSPLFFELIVEPNSELLPKCGVTIKETDIVSNSLENMDPLLTDTDLRDLLSIAGAEKS